MKPQETVRFRVDSINLLNILLKYWKVLLIAGIIIFAVSAAVSLTITPLYRSTVVLYPTTNVIETQTLFGMQNRANPLFGDESATEKILQILKSDIIKNYLVSKYDLIKHYDISEDAKYKYTLLDARMNKYIISRKTQYNSVEVSVLDKDAVIAATMANDIAGQIDTVFNQIVMDAGRKSYSAISNSYNEQFSRVKSLEDSLKKTAGGRGATAIPANIRAEFRYSSWAASSDQNNPDLLRLIYMFESENENLSAIQSRLTEAKMLAEQKLPYTHIINAASVAEKKALPKRSVIVISATLSTLLLIFFILALSEMIVRDEK